MKVLHRGFDTLALSIQANISPDLFTELDDARDRAEEIGTPIPFSYGGADFDIRGYGGNGYRFILQGGPLDVTWFIKKPNARDPWGIRISVGSTFLATQGLGRVRAYIDQTLTELGVKYGSQQVSISRADFCIDVLAPDFELIPDQVVIHSHANRSDHLTLLDDMTSNGKSGRFTSVTAGKMPGRQVIIYDKRREVIDKHKPIWWNIWNANLAREGLPPLDPKDAAQSRVWRIEIRAGKTLLKDRWKIRTWAQLDTLFGDVVAEAFQKIRYCMPSETDSNRARWPSAPIWELAEAEAQGDLTEMRSHLDPDKVKYVHRQEHIRLMMAQVIGNATTLAALEGVQESDLTDYAKALGNRMALTLTDDAERTSAKLEGARARYRFIEDLETANH
jgi:transposase